MSRRCGGESKGCGDARRSLFSRVSVLWAGWGRLLSPQFRSWRPVALGRCPATRDALGDAGRISLVMILLSAWVGAETPGVPLVKGIGRKPPDEGGAHPHPVAIVAEEINPLPSRRSLPRTTVVYGQCRPVGPRVQSTGSADRSHGSRIARLQQEDLGSLDDAPDSPIRAGIDPRSKYLFAPCFGLPHTGGDRPLARGPAPTPRFSGGYAPPH